MRPMGRPPVIDFDRPLARQTVTARGIGEFQVVLCPVTAIRLAFNRGRSSLKPVSEPPNHDCTRRQAERTEQRNGRNANCKHPREERSPKNSSIRMDNSSDNRVVAGRQYAQRYGISIAVRSNESAGDRDV